MYFVSRQKYWPDGDLFVEIAAGGQDHANPDMLVPEFCLMGEGKEYLDPREALEAAFKIREAWRRFTDEEIFIGHGATGGMTMPFSASTDEELESWAENAYAAALKCDVCGDVMSKRNYWTHSLCMGDENFCSSECAEKDYENQARANAEVPFEEVKQFLIDSDVCPKDNDTLELVPFAAMLKSAEEKLGEQTARELADWFMPTGEAVNPGIEDSLSHYVFLPFTWEQFERDWKDDHSR